MSQEAQPIKAVAPRPRIAVIGSGYWGKNLVRNIYDLQALEMVCDTSVLDTVAILSNSPLLFCGGRYDCRSNPTGQSGLDGREWPNLRDEQSG
jgi:hypothetical protein